MNQVKTALDEFLHLLSFVELRRAHKRYHVHQCDKENTKDMARFLCEKSIFFLFDN